LSVNAILQSVISETDHCAGPFVKLIKTGAIKINKTDFLKGDHFTRCFVE